MAHLNRKTAGKGEDPRYENLLGGDFSPGNVLRKIFVMQAAVGWFISLPLQLSASPGRRRRLLRSSGARRRCLARRRAFSRPSAIIS